MMREKLIKYRGDRSQEEMAKKYGVSQQAWSKYENGTAVPAPNIMLRIENDSKMKMEDIFFDAFKQPNVVKKEKHSCNTTKEGAEK